MRDNHAHSSIGGVTRCTRRRFLKSGVTATAALAAPPLWAADTAAARPDDAELLAAARERLASVRQGEAVVLVRDGAGKPVPGVAVQVEQQRHDFLFGCNLFGFGRQREAELETAYRSRFAGVFNFATLGFYWMWYEPERGQPQYAYTQQAAEWAREHGIRCKGHPLVWDWVPDPKWLPEDREEIRQLSNGRVRDCVTRFKDWIDLWDVVNEPTDLTRSKSKMSAWARSLGAVPYVRQHLEIARAANPNATLLVNDYRTDGAFYRILDGLREQGRLLFDVVGIQSHMHDGGWPLRRIGEVCDTYARLGRPIHFTETTIVSGPRRGPGESWHPTDERGEARQAEYVPLFYTLLFAHPSVEAITWWDFSDRGAWQGAAAGWVRKDMSPKPVYERMQQLIRKEWWTRGEGTTDARGEWRLRAFYGEHRVTARLPSGRRLTRSVRWQRGQPNRVDLVI